MDRRRIVIGMALAVTLGYWASVQSVIGPPLPVPFPLPPDAPPVLRPTPSAAPWLKSSPGTPPPQGNRPLAATSPTRATSVDTPVASAEASPVEPGPGPMPGKSELEGAAKKLGYDPSPTAVWRSRLFTPTYLTHIRGLWFVVDCWHNRVLYSPDLDRPIGEWRDLVSAVASSRVALGESGAIPHKPIRIPHSVATDGGDLLVLESSVGGSDGADHSLVAYRLPLADASAAEREKPLEFLQEVVLCKNARRPHRVEFHAASQAFYVYMTNPATLARVHVRQGRLSPDTECFALPFMKGTYARSFVVRSLGDAFAETPSITPAPLVAGEGAEPAGVASSSLDDAMFITAGPGVISVLNFTTTPVKFVRGVSVKPLGFGKGRMNDLQWIDGWWYATSTAPCAILRFKNLRTMRPVEALTKPLGLCGTVSTADKKSKRCRTGTPYFVTRPEASSKRLYVPYIFGCSGIVSFTIGPEEGAEVRDVRHHWSGGWVEQKDDLAVLGGW